MYGTDNKKHNKNPISRALVFIAVIITAIAVAVTAALFTVLNGSPNVPVDNVDGGEVHTSTAITNPASGTSYTAVGAISVGDTITFTSQTNPYIYLPSGTYTIEAWGGQGGKGNGGAGGYGGYVKATYQKTNSNALYICVGGAGSQASSNGTTVAGGYNGGGSAKFWRTCSHYCGTGGGATHVATASGLLSSLSSNTGAVLLVAGGGGGGHGSPAYAGGNGGPSGGNGNYNASATNYAYGGTTSGGGTSVSGSYTGSSINSHLGGAGSFGKGGDGASASRGAGGGGGGGGYYGGAGGATSTGCAACSGGGGANYISGSLTAVSNSSQTTRTGAGQVIITVVKLNQNPTSRGASITVGKRGTSASIAASTLASDPEGTAVYFTAGNSSNFDTIPGSNAGLFVNSGCTTLATNYFDWTWTNTTLSITNIKKFPRNGVDGSTLDGRITLYTRVRDNYGTAVNGRGTAVVSFTVTVTKNTISQLASTDNANFNSGTSALSSAPTDPASVGTGIYHPSGTGKRTVFIKRALAINNTVTITAASILAGDGTNGALYSGDMPVISIPSTANIASSVANRKYKVNELDNNTNVINAYDMNKVKIDNAFSQITIQAVAPDSAYQVLPVRLYAVERSTVLSSPLSANISAGIGYVDVDIVFLLENTRPVLGNVSNIVDVGVNTTLSLKLSTYFADADGIGDGTHTISDVVVPENEFIQLSGNRVNRGDIVNIASPNTGMYNIGSVTADTMSTGQGDRPTGFNQNIAYNTVKGGTDISNSAFIRYSYSGDILTVVGLRSSFNQYTRSSAPGHFYLLIKITDPRNPSDDGIWLPLAFRVGYNTSHAPIATVTSPASSTGQSNVSYFPTASGKTGDVFYFAPMAINYNGSHVVGSYINAEGEPTNSGLIPLAIDGDSFATETGIAAWGDATGATLNEFLRLSDTTTLESVVRNMSADGISVAPDGSYAENNYIRAEFVNIYVPQSSFAHGRIVVGGGTAGDDGYKYISLDASNIDGVDYYVTKGIKLTLKASTMNRYFYTTAGVVDSTGKSQDGIKIAVRIADNAPLAETNADNVALFSDSENANSYSSYSYTPGGAGTAGIPTITYRVPLGSKFIVTPYDFIYDPDMEGQYVNAHPGKFTLNGVRGAFDPATGTLVSGVTAATGQVTFNGLFDPSVYSIDNYRSVLNSTISGQLSVKEMSSTTSGSPSDSLTETNVKFSGDKLFFVRSDNSDDAYTYAPTDYSNILITATNTNGFVEYNFGNKLIVGTDTFDMDYIVVTTTTRTAQHAYLDLSVRDRFGNSTDGNGTIAVRIVIDVVNTAPTVKTPSRYEQLAVTPITQDGTVMPSTLSFTANGNGASTGLMTDADGDTPDFIATRGVLVANIRDLGTRLRNISSFDDENIDPAWLTDEFGTPLTSYISAALVSRYELSVSALSSTKAIEGGVFVYFFVTDGNGGTSLGYVQVEVINTPPVLNTSADNGFAETDRTWTVESTSNADIRRDRYIVGSQSANDKLIATRGAVESDIRTIATDADGLHSRVTLSSRTDIADSDTGEFNGKFIYNNLAVPEDKTTPITGAAFESALPSVKTATSFDGSAIIVYTSTRGADGGITYSASVPADYVAELLFYIGDDVALTPDEAAKVDRNWITRSDLLTILENRTIDDALVAMFFDENGRFTDFDWALRLRAARGMESGVSVGISLFVRDEARLGGDTASLNTAFDPDRTADKTVVSGALRATVYQSISTTGIRTKDEYSKYNDYYVVEHTDERQNTSAYVSTYDGDTTSAYGAGVLPVTYDEVSGNNVLVTSGTGAQTLKPRAEGGADNTLAGVRSGERYNSETVADVPGAFKYEQTIEVPADTQPGSSTTDSPVYVPMSYFGLLQDMVDILDSGEVSYPSLYVGYDMGRDDRAYDRNNIDEIASAITLSDGVTQWTGTQGALALNNNPYITIGTFDLYSADGSTNSASMLSKPNSVAYYNNRLAVETTEANGVLLGYERFAANRNSFVGDGSLMYLEDQASKLLEHNFGLTFAKNNMRTGVRNLTLTINLARSRGNLNNTENNSGNRRTVTVKIHVENSKFDLSTSSGAGDASVLKFDEEKGTYYADITLPSASTRSFMLARRNASGVESGNPSYSGAQKIAYIDNDYHSENYRDSVYFYGDSFNDFADWSTVGGAKGYKRLLDTVEADGKTVFKNVAYSADNDRAQQSVANYLGLNKDTLAAGADTIGGDFAANSGKYGYEQYFSASLSDNGRVVNIMANRKTYINSIAFEKAGELSGVDTTSQTAVAAAYAARGLVAEYNDAQVNPLTPSRVYYPFKVLVYDNCGLGWNDASYVAFELRIEVTNAAPTLKRLSGSTLNNEYRINLAVGNSITLSLYDFVSDSDINATGSNGYYMLPTKSEFENSTGIELETGDYLDSPFAHDEYLSGELVFDPQNCIAKGDGTYYINGGGLSAARSTERDVVMWMETSSSTVSPETLPGGNTLTFTVNNRTTLMREGRSVSVNEYRFRIRFFDGEGECTDYITFIISVTNQTPRLTAMTRNITMHSGDDITILSTYYDNFTGVDRNNPTKENVAYNNSASKTYYDRRVSSVGYGETFGDGQNNGTAGKFWKYGDITSSMLSSVIYNSDTDRTSSAAMHLGYLGIADDDTPWKLRISSYSYYNGINAKLRVTPGIALRAETDAATPADLPLAITVTAIAACVNEPLTLEISDGENGVVKCVFYFTVISTPPVPLDSNNEIDKSLINVAGLEAETDGLTHEPVSGTFRLFTVPYDEAAVSVDGFEDVKHARKEYTIGMENVAKDPDGNDETSSMTLYNNGEFAVNGVPLVIDAYGVYRSDYFELRIQPGGRAFSLTATGYNPDTTVGYEELTFRVADAGNGVYENSILIKLHVYTLYSDMTNPTVAAMSSEKYTEYLDGSSEVYVKSYDDFYGATTSERSKFAVLKLDGNTGVDNSRSPVVDRDVSATGKQNYTIRLYALMDNDENGEFKALSSEKLADMFKRGESDGTFRLSAGDTANYLIGGRMYDGTTLSVTPSALSKLAEVNKYANFDFAADGSAVYFTPNAATLDNDNIRLYVEVEKNVDTGRANAKKDAVLASGELFTLVVADSKPMTVSNSASTGFNAEVSGVKGDKIRLKIFDKQNPFGALFTDSDAFDLVTVEKFDDAAYVKALAKAVEADPELDWAATETKPRAFDLDIDTETNELVITINRRMDKFENDRYVPTVSFPIEITGVDKAGETVVATVRLSIGNLELSASNVITDSFNSDGVGYMLTPEESGLYVIDARLNFSTPLEINIADFISDRDITDGADTDSFVFATSSIDRYPYSYLTDETQTAYWYATSGNGQPDPDSRVPVATVEPCGADKWHRTGFKITAVSTSRMLSASTYIRVLDRSADRDERDTGIYIRLDITVLNDAPQIKTEANAPTVYLMGSDEDSGIKGKLFYIGDFVEDKNVSDVVGDELSAQNPNTYLRLFTQFMPNDDNVQVYSTKESSIDGASLDSSALFNVIIPNTLPEDLLEEYKKEHPEAANKNTSNDYLQWFVIYPNASFYGFGSVDITVADGNTSVMSDSRTATFRINVQVLCDPDSAGDMLNPVKIACRKSINVDIASLLPEYENKLVITGSGEQPAPEEGGAVVSADGDNTFTQSEFYRLTSVVLQNDSDKVYATVERVGESGVWRLTAGTRITVDPIRVNVTYELINDPTKTYSKYFRLSVVANVAPKIKFTEIKFMKYNDGEPDMLRDLDDNNTVRIEAWQLFSDDDDPQGSALRLISAKSSVPSLVQASLSEDGRFLIIKFVACGRATIEVEVTDETGDVVKLPFTAINEDLPTGSFWLRIVSSFESNTVIWIVIIALIILLLIILIIIITVARNRKRAREEMEALLVSEMAIEDEMLKLASGSMPGDYQSYGYLPPSASTGAPDPSALLGSSEAPDPQLAELPPPPEAGTNDPAGDGGAGDNA